MAKVNDTKKEAINFRVHAKLKQRFQEALKSEGLGQTQFFVAKMQEFCERVEAKNGKNR
ncbi:hypothetical protein [Laceyella sacchari]|uniref:Uncharacterized protein n=1 Tax=Laceyella sacchari TaxID=37482 RepID=A0ABY5U6Q6_LACSH|nr:hypothetical protein [Laceyella sacchari]UWE05324.1 hypothetical protein NYR52_16530 [Laceyella sacchari]